MHTGFEPFRYNLQILDFLPGCLEFGSLSESSLRLYMVNSYLARTQWLCLPLPLSLLGLEDQAEGVLRLRGYPWLED